MISSGIFIFTITLIIAYLLGSLSSAIIVCRLAGLPDPRTEGSKNPGTTNVLRLGGKKWAAIVLLGDMLKGVLAIVLAMFFIPSTLLVWVGVAVVVGHLYPIFFGFEGGKGVATAAGVLLALAWPLGLAVMATWIVIAFISRYSSLAALVATVVTPVYAYFFAKEIALLPLLFICLLILWRHRSNIQRLFLGQETKMGSK